MDWNKIIEMKDAFGDVLVIQDGIRRGPLREIREDDDSIVIVADWLAVRTLHHTWERHNTDNWTCRISKTVQPRELTPKRVYIFTPEVGTINLCLKDDLETLKPDSFKNVNGASP